MGDGAIYALNQWVKAGMPAPRENKVTRTNCDFCGKEVHGKAALMQHINAKHDPKRYSFQDIDFAKTRELYGDNNE